MKLSIGLFAAVSAVGPDFERPKVCEEYDNNPDISNSVSDNIVNCWSPSGHFATQNGTAGFVQTNDGGECGVQYIDTGLSLVNQTCTFVPAAVDGSYDVGNAVFVAKGPEAGPNEIVGFDITGDFNYVQKWNVGYDWTVDFNDKLDAYVAAVEEANENNTTQPEPFSYERTYPCADEFVGYTLPSAANCGPSNGGDAYPQYAIMITNQHAEDKNNNYAIANYGDVDNVFTITIDGSCNDYGFTEHDSNQATMVKLDGPADKCIYQVTVLNPAAQLFYFQGSIDEGVIDFFNGVDIEQA